MSMYKTKSLNVVKLIIQQTGTYDEQYQRPYTTQLDVHTQNDILEAVSGKAHITPTAVATATMGFITPSATPERAIGIVNGWNIPRLRFLLQLHEVDQMNMAQTFYVTGYTEYSDLSMHNRVDPKMMFYINNISITKTVNYNTPLGNQSYQNLIDSSHVLVNDSYTSIFDNQKVYDLTPESVLDDIGALDLGANGDLVINTISTMNRTPTKADRKNNIGSVYVARVLDGYLQTSRQADFESHSTMLENTRAGMQSMPYTQDPFLMRLQALHNRQGNGTAISNTFTLNDLCEIDANTPHVMKLAEYQAGGTYQAGRNSGWGGSDGVTLFAATLAQALPAYLTQFCFNSTHFTSTNYTMSGSIESTVNDVKGFNNGLDLSREVAAFIYRVNTELLAGLSYGNKMPFQLEVRCDLIGETWIELSLNGEPSMCFVTPSFCDSLTTPITTTNVNNLHGIASDFDRLMTAITENDNGRKTGSGASQIFI